MDAQNTDGQNAPAQTAVPVVAAAVNPQPPPVQPLPAPDGPIPPVPPGPGIPANGVEEKKSRMSPLIIIGGLVVLLLVGLSAAFYFFNTQLKQQTAQAVPVGPTAIPMVPIKTLIIGTDATYPPMESIDDKGTLVGYDIDLGNKIAEELGAKAEFKNIPWDDVFKSLEDKKVDVIISSVTITDERKKLYLFSSPYINAGQVILTKKENTVIVSPAELKGKRVGVQKDTTSETEAVKYTDAKLVTSYADYGEAAKALVASKLDAVIIDLTAGKGIVDKYPTLKISGDPFTNEYYGIVLRQDGVSLQSRINQAISSLHERGVLDDIKQKWFQ
jgi:polar amino acid transport system substrate-binding protein